jgi:hypothetical protein
MLFENDQVISLQQTEDAFVIYFISKINLSKEKDVLRNLNCLLLKYNS